MVVGESGLGKSTLINTLFNTQIIPPREIHIPQELPKTIDIRSLTSHIEENGVRLKLTVVDTPGFGDFINNEQSWKPILGDIEARYNTYLEQETRVHRHRLEDNRIHACIYFIAPTGHSLKPIDIELMRRLHKRVNLIPVIGKADTMSNEEIISFKQRIMADIEHHEIQIYQASTYEHDDIETVSENREIMSKIPFAIVGSNHEYTTQNGHRFRGRLYPWGIIEVDNEDHCDFVKLRQMLIRSHMEELKEHTNDVLYENYRTERLSAMGFQQDASVFQEVNPQQRMEERRIANEQRLAKLQSEMNAILHAKAQDKERKLKQSEQELYIRHREMKEALDRQLTELEEKKRRLDIERTKKKGFAFK
ncbi:Putative Peanut-like protein 1 (Cell division control like protein 1) [Rhizopus microsporus]|nr:Putative Peanut-like protein 1 (Cell division control like protein 1) [Rhizopus microsporus]